MNDEQADRSSFIVHRSSLNAAFDELRGRRIILIGGKGGVGKTTVSVAAALHRAKSQRAILFTTDPASNLQDIFATTRPPEQLTIESLDAERLYSLFLEKNLSSFLELGDRGTYLEKEELKRFFELSLPGVDELMAWMHIGELAEANEDAAIIVDTAPTGHTLRMLGASQHFRQFAAALDAMQEKHRGMVRQFTRRDVHDALDEFIEQFEATAARRRALLEAAAFVAVTLSEPLVIEQTKRLIAEVGIGVPFVVLNRAITDPDCARDRERATRDAEAREAFGVRVVDAARACVPLDTLEKIEAWSGGIVGSAGLQAAAPRQWRRFDAASPASLQAGAPGALLFLAGKGGVGKTTSAASIAIQLAKTQPVTAISVDPAHSLRDLNLTVNNLTIEIVDTRAKWNAFRESLGDEIDRAIGAIAPKGMTVAYDADAMKKLVEIAPPGADELFAITRLADLIAENKTVVVDTAPTGHFLRLIDLPKSAGEWVREFMRILLRYKDLIPPGSLGEELIRASRALTLVSETMRSDRCNVIVVTRPERIVVAETKRLIAEVESRGMHVGAVIANYVTPESDCPCDQSMRSYEADALAALDRDDIVIVERRDVLDDLASLVIVSDSEGSG
jgi:arsenite-transporting ATPase